MNVPTRAERRALFADALNRAGYSGIVHSDAAAIRAAVEVVLGDPAKDVKDLVGTTTARHRAQFLALADAIEGVA
jgi:hypothetical protein